MGYNYATETQQLQIIENQEIIIDKLTDLNDFLGVYLLLIVFILVFNIIHKLAEYCFGRK